MAIANLTWTPASSTGSQQVYFKAHNVSTYTLFSTIASTASSETVTGLSNNIVYDFKVENSCGGTPASILTSQINITCPSFSTVTPHSNSIDFAFFSISGSSDITSYKVDLLNASNVVLNTILFSHTPFGNNQGIFSALIPTTNYQLRITVYAGSYSKTCTSTSVSTTAVQGFWVNNIDYDNDDICPQTTNTGVVVIDNATGNAVLGNLNVGQWLTSSNHVQVGQSTLVFPIPAGDDLYFGGYKGCPSPVTGTLGKRSWIQAINATGTIIDLDLVNPDDEIQKSVSITGKGISNGWIINVRKSAYFLPFRIDNDTNPSAGGTHTTQLVGMRPTTTGTGKEYSGQTTNPSITIGGTWDVYYKDREMNPFGIPNNGTFLLSAVDRTPSGNAMSGGASYPAFVNIANKSYFMTNDTTKTYGEKYVSFSNTDLRNANNIAIVTQDRSSLRGYPNINSISRVGTTLNITSTWTAGSVSSSSTGRYEFYVIMIKDRGLGTEVSTHVPSNVVWGPTYGGVIPFAYAVPSVGTTSTVSVTLPTIPTSYTTLEARIIALVNDPALATVEEYVSHHATLHTI